jgi:hypothetical protein
MVEKGRACSTVLGLHTIRYHLGVEGSFVDVHTYVKRGRVDTGIHIISETREILGKSR